MVGQPETQETIMADQKKRGFHALEQRIHQMEEEDSKKQQQANPPREGQQPRSEPGEPKPRK